MKPVIIIIVLLFLVSSPFCLIKLNAQLYMVGLSSDESIKGPIIKTDAITLYRKKDYFNFRPTDILTQVTFEFSDFKIKSEEISSPLVFGASSRNTMNIVNSQPVLQDFKSIGSPSPTLFTNSRTERTDFSITYNYGVCIFASVRHLSQAKKPAIGEKIEYGMLNIKFNRSISNPILHINGMGSLLEREQIERGYSVEFELVSPNINLMKISGTDNLIVDKRYIENNSNRMGANYGMGAASGSVLVEGSDMTELQFRVYVKRDQRNTKYRGRWPLLRNIHPGDALLLGISFENDYDLSLEFRPEGVQPELSEFLKSELEGNIYFNLIDYKKGIVLASRSFRENTSTVISGLTPASTYRIGFSDKQFELSTLYVQVPMQKSITIIAEDLQKGRLTTLNDFEFEFKPIGESDTKLSFKIGSKEPLAFSELSEIEINEETTNQNKLEQDTNVEIDTKVGNRNEKDSMEVSNYDHINRSDSIFLVQNIQSTNEDNDYPIAIIVGSFVKIENANKMEQLLRRKGFNVYRGQGPEEFTRVGIKLDEKSKPDETLHSYRKTIAPDAWYLYNLDVLPYINANGFL
jgi:hypothetical protein